MHLAAAAMATYALQRWQVPQSSVLFVPRTRRMFFIWYNQVAAGVNALLYTCSVTAPPTLPSVCKIHRKLFKIQTEPRLCPVGHRFILSWQAIYPWDANSKSFVGWEIGISWQTCLFLLCVVVHNVSNFQWLRQIKICCTRCCFDSMIEIQLYIKSFIVLNVFTRC